MKTIGGVGYILSLIPLIGMVAPVLVGIAWLRMGGRTGRGVFKATGVLMLIQFAVALAFLITFPLLIPLLPILSSLPFTSPSSMPESFSEATLTRLLGNILAFIIMGTVAAAIAIAAFVLELISHFRAAMIFNVRWFRYAAWLRIISAIIIIAFGVIVGLSAGLAIEATTQEELAMALLGASLLGGVAAMVIPHLLGVVFSAVAFFKTPEEPQQRSSRAL